MTPLKNQHRKGSRVRQAVVAGAVALTRAAGGTTAWALDRFVIQHVEISLLDNGEVAGGIEDVEVDTNFGNHSIQGEQPRTAVGIIDQNHLVFVAVDGRSPGYSAGVTMTGLAQIMKDLGATTAYNIDGGGSSTMYFNGGPVNNPLGENKELGTSDVLYIAQ